jgi:hypothetical protein
LRARTWWKLRDTTHHWSMNRHASSAARCTNDSDAMQPYQRLPTEIKMFREAQPTCPCSVKVGAVAAVSRPFRTHSSTPSSGTSSQRHSSSTACRWCGLAVAHADSQPASQPGGQGHSTDSDPGAAAQDLSRMHQQVAWHACCEIALVRKQLQLRLAHRCITAQGSTACQHLRLWGAHAGVVCLERRLAHGLVCGHGSFVKSCRVPGRALVVWCDGVGEP